MDKELKKKAIKNIHDSFEALKDLLDKVEKLAKSNNEEKSMSGIRLSYAFIAAIDQVIK